MPLLLDDAPDPYSTAVAAAVVFSAGNRHHKRPSLLDNPHFREDNYGKATEDTP
jgi:hypothetical protein